MRITNPVYRKSSKIRVAQRHPTANFGGTNNKKITKVKDRNKILINQLLNIWESSVKVMHLFLSKGKKIKQYVPQALNGVPILIIAEDENGISVGLWGLQWQILEMLFVSNENRRQGIGKRLLQYGIERYSVNELAVNEQNP